MKKGAKRRGRRAVTNKELCGGCWALGCHRARAFARGRASHRSCRRGLRRLRRRIALRRMLGVGSPKSQSIRPEGGPPTEAAGVYAEIASQKCVAADAGRGVAKEPEHSPRGRASHRSCRGICGDCVAEVLCGGCCARGCQRARAFAPRAGLPQKL